MRWPWLEDRDIVEESKLSHSEIYCSVDQLIGLSENLQVPFANAQAVSQVVLWGGEG